LKVSNNLPALAADAACTACTACAAWLAIQRINDVIKINLIFYE
jgi:hypothetical protein